jgi:hypothetical protein
MPRALTANYTSTQNVMRRQPVRGTDLTTPVSGASDVRLWFAIETLGKPLHATYYRRREQQQVAQSQEQQATADSFNFRLTCFKADLEDTTLRSTRGPRCDGKAASWIGGLYAAA